MYEVFNIIFWVVVKVEYYKFYKKVGGEGVVECFDG